MQIDAHQHFWHYNAQRDAWITPEMTVIRRNFGPANLHPLLTRHGIDGCVAVQANQSETENEWLLAHAAVRLAYYRQFGKMKGFRHVLQSEADRALLLTPTFRRGIVALGSAYDLLILPDQLAYAHQLAGDFSTQPFVLDHLVKPPIRTREVADWASEVRALVALGNTWCKVSSLITEADWHAWQPENFRPYLDVLFEAFGTAQVLFGSDWPVCNLAGGCAAAVGLVSDYLAAFSATEKAQFWGDNATELYPLHT